MARGPQPHPMSLARKKYARHKAQAKFRNIEFKFSFDEWYNWWLSNGVDKNLHSETYTKQDPNRMCMCRYGDVGAYEPSNVYCATHVQNARDEHTFDKRAERNMPKKYWWGHGSELVNILELRKLSGNPQVNGLKFKPDVYDYWRQSESRRLTNQFRQQYGTLRTRTEYEYMGAWYPTIKSAAQACGHDPDWYKRRLRLGYQGFSKRITRHLRDYILEHTVFPDPIIPVDQ